MREQRSKQPGTLQHQHNLLDQALGQVEALQHELDTLRGQLARENRLEALGALAAGLAHESNNLLTPIGTYAQLALANPTNTELVQRALRVAAEGAAKVGRLNASALRMVSSPTDANPCDCLASEVVNDTIQMVMPLLQKDQVAIDVDVPECIVRMDALALQQVLINLINNARHAMLAIETQRRISISALVNKGFLALRVSDCGPGIPEAMKEHLFNAYTSMKQQRKNEKPEEGLRGTNDANTSSNNPMHAKPGSGLGLSICKQLIESAGGRITLDTSAQSGAAFVIELPTLRDSAGACD